MSFKKWLLAALVTVLGAPLMAVVAAPSASAACPAGNVGRFQTAFRPDGVFDGTEEMWWYLSGQSLATDVGEGSDIVLDVAIWPFEKGGNRFTLEAPDGRDFIEVDFDAGKVTLSGSAPGGDYAYHPDAMTYRPAAWNNLRVRFDLDGDQARVDLNGQQLSFPSEAGSQIMQLWFANSFRTSTQDTQTAYVDNLTVKKVTGDVVTTLYVEDFEDAQAEGAYPAISFTPTIWQPSPGSGCKQTSVLSVLERQTSERITVTGSVVPAAAGWPVWVQLSRKKDGAFVPVGKVRKLVLDHDSAFRTSYAQPPGARKCRTTVTFKGTPTMFGDEEIHTFAC